MTASIRRIPINASLATCLACLAALCVVVAFGIAGVAASLASGGIDQHAEADELAALAAAHDRRLIDYTQRFDGRSPFFIPARKTVENAATQPTSMSGESIGKVAAHVPPEYYSGPRIMWAIGADVYFSKTPSTRTEKYFRLRTGEQADGVRVLVTSDLPRSVRVAHAGGEYDVPLFGNRADGDSLFADDEAVASDLDGIVPAGVTQ